MKKYAQSCEEIAKNLKFFRNYLSITQEEIADKLSIDRSTYSYYELGRTVPSIFALIKIAEMFDVAVDLLISNNLFSEGNKDLILWKNKQYQKELNR